MESRTIKEIVKVHNKFIQDKEKENRRIFSKIEQGYKELSDEAKAYLKETKIKMNECAAIESEDVKFDLSPVEKFSDEDLHGVSNIVTMYKEFMSNDVSIKETVLCNFGFSFVKENMHNEGQEKKLMRNMLKGRTAMRIVDDFSYLLGSVVHERFISPKTESKEKINTILRRRRGQSSADNHKMLIS